VLAALCAAVSLGGCASPWPNESADLSAQDSATALRVKAALIDAPELAGAAIDVTMEDGRARLAGFVETAEQRRLAERIAGREDGVDGVINDIVVK
jgi:osmotically-inducible protein OsmY